MRGRRTLHHLASRVGVGRPHDPSAKRRRLLGRRHDLDAITDLHGSWPDHPGVQSQPARRTHSGCVGTTSRSCSPVSGSMLVTMHRWRTEWMPMTTSPMTRACPGSFRFEIGGDSRRARCWAAGGVRHDQTARPRHRWPPTGSRCRSGPGSHPRRVWRPPRHAHERLPRPLRSSMDAPATVGAPSGSVPAATVSRPCLVRPVSGPREPDTCTTRSPTMPPLVRRPVCESLTAQRLHRVAPELGDLHVDHKSTTRSVPGVAQQIRRLPPAGGSTGSGS